jgi:hypothetical protein
VNLGKFIVTDFAMSELGKTVENHSENPQIHGEIGDLVALEMSKML